MTEFTGSTISDCNASVDKVLGEKRSAKEGSPAESCCEADVLLSQEAPIDWIRCDWSDRDASLRFVKIVPPVFCPRGGQVTIEATGESAILRVFDARFEQLEVRL